MKTFFSWAVRIVVALILVQTLYFKFTAAPESVYIFEQTGLGAPGRIGSGIAELIAAILLLLPRTAWLGALMALGIISGALFFHLTSLGIEVMGDGGTLFYLAVAVFVGSAITLFLEREKWMETVQGFTSKG
ncbi:MAG TPA: DoxX family protein [Bacteroidetes bacterium]|nr:DoxX family protein [Bacteroidota bacterium]